jgi:hypothetical protein
VVARVGGRPTWWSTMERPGRGREVGGSAYRLADTDMVTPAGATLPSQRALGEAILPGPCAYRGNPRTSPTSSGCRRRILS